MIMRLNFQLLLLLFIKTATAQAQNDLHPSLNISDPTPPLQVRGWIKGEPVERFEKGHVYVLEFWATWCKPCIAAMPHLSTLASEYKDRVTILGIDIYEKKTTSMEIIKAFVDSMGHLMDYHVATDDSNFMVTGWLNASGEQGIPKSFVVNAEGRVAWIGHPVGLDEVLPKIVNDNWDLKEALAKRNLDKHLKELDDEANYKLNTYVGDPFKPGDLGKPDSALLMINELVNNEPKLKYATFIASHTFSSLLKTDPHKAYEFGKELLVISTFEDSHYGLMIDNIKWYSDKLNLPAEIYRLGAEAYQAEIDNYPWSMKTPNTYREMANWYWRASDKSKAIKAQEQAIEALKSKKKFSKNDLAVFEAQLKHYKDR
jgi:thiol-disulfide isomerase/thioredoxin